MAVTHSMIYGFQRNGESITKQKDVSVGAEQMIDESIPDSSTDLLVALNVDISQLKSLYMVADRAVTLQTNNGTTPTDTIALVANEPISWFSGSGLANPFSADITALYVTNASGGAARLQIRAGYDPTL